MDLLEQIVARAKADKQRIVLPEAEEERTLRAADRVLADDIANLILIGNPANIHKLAEEWGLKNIDKATIVDPENNPQSEEYAEKLAELRQKKGMTIEQARELGAGAGLVPGALPHRRQALRERRHHPAGQRPEKQTAFGTFRARPAHPFPKRPHRQHAGRQHPLRQS